MRIPKRVKQHDARRARLMRAAKAAVKRGRIAKSASAALKSEKAARELASLDMSQDVSGELKAWRALCGFTQREAAELLGVPLRSYEGYEAGRPFPYPLILRAALVGLSGPKWRLALPDYSETVGLAPPVAECL